ncbi:MAG: transglycosylase domain-containing protein, partial [Anaerolineaceae bacterium]|nr:transglycosylase domain-containing protein [Anaerolineaceae bacterium]
MVRAGLGCAALSLLVVVVGMLAGSLLYVSLVKNLPSLDLLPELLNPSDGLLMRPTRIYDRSGQKLLMSLDNPGVSRRYLYMDPNQADHFSPELIRVIVGYFDPGFWKNPGVDFTRLTDPQPYTIAERLVNDLLLWQESPGLARTLRMKLLAAQITSRYGQVQVLEWYLNSAYFGHLAFGADSAAHLYLDSSATKLDLPQAALLAAALQAPALNSVDAPAVALKGQKDVLRQLLSRRVIDEEEYLRAVPAELHLAQPPAATQALARAFTQLVLERLSQQISRERLERGGLKVITTLD